MMPHFQEQTDLLSLTPSPMTRPISKMIALAAPDAYPRLFLEGRIFYRKRWALETPTPARKFGTRDRKWELDYDDEYNFAHMGARYIEDEEWGKPKPAKPKKTTNLSPEAQRLLSLMRAAAK